MFKFIAATSACALGLCAPVAMAETELIEVAIAYDVDLLSTGAGIATVLDSVEEQARDACTVRTSSMSTALYTVDRACTESIVEGAISQIEARQGVDFASLTPAASPLVLSSISE